MVSKIDQRWFWYLVLAGCSFFSFYFAIGSYPLFDNNEGLYAGIAKQMLLYRDFIIPHANGVPYIEKPPLLYWLLSSSFSLFGFTAFAARLITSTSAVLLCVAIVYFGKKISQFKVGMIGSIIFSSSLGVSIIARMVYFDMLFTLLVSCTLLCFFYWYDREKIGALRAGYLFFGLAILTKGLIAAVVVGGSLGAFLILERDFRRLYKLIDPVGIVLFLVIVLPWHVAANVQHKGFIWHYFVEEHFLRFLNQREPHDYYHGPIYYYLPRIMIYLFPWSLFLPLVFWRRKQAEISEQKLLRFCWCWLLVPLLFFSISSAKANYYMIVSMPALAVMLSVKMRNLFGAGARCSKIFNCWVALIMFVVAVMIGGGYVFFSNASLPIAVTCKWAMIVTIGYSLIVGLAASICVRRSLLVFMLMAGLIIPVTITMVSYIQANDGKFSTAAAGVFLGEQKNHGILYIYQDFEDISALSFYAPTDFKIIDSKSSDLYYGAHLPEFQRGFVNKHEFLQNVGNEQAYIVVPKKKLVEFERDMVGAKFFLCKEFDRVVIMQLLFSNAN